MKNIALKTPQDNGFVNIDSLIDLKCSLSQLNKSNSSSKASSISGSDKENNLRLDTRLITNRVLYILNSFCFF